MTGVEGDVARLRAAGMRVTSARLAILDVIGEGHHHGADEVARAVRDRIGHVTLQAVYEALGAFADAGLVRKIELGGGAARYESRVGDHHHHLACRRCGAIADTDGAAGPAPGLEPACLEPLARLGYTVDEAEVTFWGLCPGCRPGPGR